LLFSRRIYRRATSLRPSSSRASMERQGDRTNPPCRRLFRVTWHLPAWACRPVDRRTFRRRVSRVGGDSSRWVRNMAGTSSEVAAGQDPPRGTAVLG